MIKGEIKMLKTIIVNYETIEMMQFYWESVASKDKVVDSYFVEVANKPGMDVIFGDDFTTDSFRKVLSAIMNRERLNGPTKKESKFWNLNMWMLEDLDNMRNMLKPIKTLNLDELKEEFKGSSMEELIINFVPGHDFTYFINDNVLTINFFRLMATFDNPTDMKIEGKPFRDFVVEKAKEVLSK